MKIKRKIEVTKEDIKKGVPSEVHKCPVALAVNRALRITNVDVGEDIITFRFNDGEFDLALPEKVVDWIEHFDKKEEVRPFKFTLVGDSL